MTLSSVNDGFVLLRNLWEYNSILKYRYKKRKAYKVATMKHLPAPLAREYKPNLAVKMVKTTLSHFRDGLQGIGSLISDEPNDGGWTRQEPKLISTQTTPKKFKFKFGDIVYYKDSSSSIHSIMLRDKAYKVEGSDITDNYGVMVRVDNVSDSKDKWWLFEKDLDFYVNKQEVNEKRISFLPFMPSNYEG